MSDKEDCEDKINASNGCSPSSPNQTDVEELRKKLKAPDNKKFERELDKLNGAIRQKEAKFRSYPKSSRSQAESSTSSSHAFKDRDTLMAELRGYKADREKEIEMRKKIDQELKATSGFVQSKTEACGKLQAGLKYKTESKVEEAIRRLEHQMRVQQLKLREEKRIVTEIDALKRSKKLIHDFDFLKNDIGQLRDKQHLLRTKRDGCMKTIARLKSKEEQVKVALDEQRHKADEARNQQKEHITEKNAIKKEIDELYDKKRGLVAAFNKEKDEYHNILRDIKIQERQIRREMEVTIKSDDRHSQKSKTYKDRSEQSMIISTHEKMLDLCETLVTYFEKMNIDTCTKPDYDSQTFQEQSQEVQGAIASFKGGTFLKKKNDDDLEGMYGGSNKKQNRKNSKKGRRSTHKENVPKKLVLHPLVLEQCLSLFITPPSTASDIPKTLELLYEKKTVLSAVLENPDAVSRDSELAAASCTEDFPSLPSQTSVEQETLSTISSTDDSIVNNEDIKTAPTTESENAVANDSEEQEQFKETEDSNEVIEHRTENQESIETEEDLKSHLNGEQDSVLENVDESDSHDVRKEFESNLNNGIDNGVPVQHLAEINNIREDTDEDHLSKEETLINEHNTVKLKKNLEANLIDQNNAEYIVNEIRNCDSQDGNPKLCSKEVLPQQINDQDSERAIDCPS